jgi:hypothetical protein
MKPFVVSHVSGVENGSDGTDVPDYEQNLI